MKFKTFTLILLACTIHSSGYVGNSNHAVIEETGVEATAAAAAASPKPRIKIRKITRCSHNTHTTLTRDPRSHKSSTNNSRAIVSREDPFCIQVGIPSYPGFVSAMVDSHNCEMTVPTGNDFSRPLKEERRQGAPWKQEEQFLSPQHHH